MIIVNEKMNKTSICSVVALDIIDYSKKTDAEQLDLRSLFNGFIQHALIDIPQDDRVIADTASGATIACNGSLEDALEDALFISITIRDEVLKNNTHGSSPLYLQFGIHLGAAQVVKNTLVGEGVEEAQRIMRFANPNQILVTNVYFEMTSKLTQEMAQMFEKYEMHAHEHEVYAVRLLKEALNEAPLMPAANAVPATGQLMATKANWAYIALSLLVLAALFVLAKSVVSPIEPAITPTVNADQPVVAETTDATELTAEPGQDDTVKEDAKKVKTTQKKPKQKATMEAEETAGKTEKPATNTAAKPVELKTDKGNNDKSGWQTFKDSVKQGAERECTQAEIAMNQCVK